MKSLFLLPQKLPKEVYVATRVLIFTCINWIKAVYQLEKRVQPLAPNVSLR